jgi:diacylglycerol kinase family enzyme
MSTPLRVLVNAYAGLGLQAGEERLARTLTESDVPAVIESVEPERLGERVRSLAGAGVLGVAGGDGTHRTAARELVGSRTTLVPFPTGTLNHFARRLGLDTVESAAAAVRAGAVRTIPIGRVGTEVFLNTAIAGAYPSFVEARARLRPFLTKWPAAVLASCYIFARWPRIDIAVRSREMETRARTAMLWVGLGRNSFPAVHLSPLPGSADSLEAVLLTATGRRAAFTLAGATLREWLGRSSNLQGATEVIRTRSLELAADHPIPMALDGESLHVASPVRIHLETNALHVPATDQYR